MSQGILCIGIGEFGGECVRQLEDWLDPPKTLQLDEQQQKTQFIAHNDEFWCLIQEELALASITAKQRPLFKESIQKYLKKMAEYEGLKEFQIFLILDAAEDTRSFSDRFDEYLQLQYVIEEAIGSMGTIFSSIRGMNVVPPEQRNIHLQFVIAAPQLSELSANLTPQQYQACRTFMMRLREWEEKIQRFGVGALRRVWITSRYLPGLVHSIEETHSASCAMIRMLCKKGLRRTMNERGEKHFKPFLGREDLDPVDKRNTSRRDWRSSPFSFFTINSATLPFGAIYKYGLYRSLFDGLEELGRRVTNDSFVDDHLRHDLNKKLKPYISTFVPAATKESVANDLMRLAGETSLKLSEKAQKGARYNEKIRIDSFVEPNVLRKKYPLLYSKHDVSMELDQVDEGKARIGSFLSLLDQTEASLIDKITTEIDQYIAKNCGQDEGLGGFADVELALKQSLDDRFENIFSWESNVPEIDPLGGYDALIEATEKVPTRAALLTNAFAIGILISAVVMGFFATPLQQVTGSATTTIQLQPVSTQDLWTTEPLIWLFQIGAFMGLGYFIATFLYREARETLRKALEYRQEVVEKFILAGGDGPVTQMAKVGLQVRKERINRAIINHIKDLLGKFQAIRSEIGRMKKETEHRLIGLGVKLSPSSSQDDISSLVHDDCRYHKCLCPPAELANWIVTCRVKGENAKWVQHLVETAWPSHHQQIFSDIPLGDEKQLYEMSYQNVAALRNSSPLSEERLSMAQKTCHQLLQAGAQSFRLICNPRDPNGQLVFTDNTENYGTKLLGISYGIRDIIERVLSDTSAPKPVVDEYSQNDDYMFYACFWHNIHGEDLLRALDPNFQEASEERG